MQEKITFVCLSDIHGEVVDNLPNGDFLILAGDIGPNLNYFWEEINWYNEIFFPWLEKQPHKNKIMIGGNHDFVLNYNLENLYFPKDVIYLYDNYVIIDGIKIWGSPRSITRSPEWAFFVPEEHLVYYWDKIPVDIDVLVTHSPPRGILDSAERKDSFESCGSISLREKMVDFKDLKLHVFGHIHESSGIANDKITYVNAAHWNRQMNEKNPIKVVQFNRELFKNYC